MTKITRYYLADEDGDTVCLTEGWSDYDMANDSSKYVFRLSRGKSIKIFATKEAIFKHIKTYIASCRAFKNHPNDKSIIKINEKISSLDEVLKVLMSCQIMKMEVTGTEPDKIDFNLDKVF